MEKIKSYFVCQNCGHKTIKWIGKCSSCNSWNTFLEEVKKSKSSIAKKELNHSAPSPISQVLEKNYPSVQTGIEEFDRVLGGGIVSQSLILLGGEPGSGKSTLLSMVVNKIVEMTKEIALYVSGEESLSQVACRMRRIGQSHKDIYIYNENTLQNIIFQIKKLRPKYVIVDSIQTIASNEISSMAGSVCQVREVTFELLNYCKNDGITIFVVGHITKDGNIAGPKVLEHMVDTVLHFENGQLGDYRILRATKNRFGNINEVGIFKMDKDGLKEVMNPSEHLIQKNLETSFGRSLSCVLEGSRPLLVEAQALVLENKHGVGRRVSQGFENGRLLLIIAVLEKYCGYDLSHFDVYINIIGGHKYVSKECDLSVMASLISSHRRRAINCETIFIGEIGLTGEVRSVANLEVRIKEVEYLNYKRVVASCSDLEKVRSLTKKVEFEELSKVSGLQTLI